MKENFAWVNPTVSEIKSLKEKYTTYKKECYKKIKSLSKEELSFDSVILGLDKSDEPYHDHFLKVHILSQVHPDKKIRDISQSTELALGNEMIDIEHDKEIWNILKSYIEGNFKKEKKNLDKASIKLAEDYYKNYKRSGFNLSDKDQDKLKVLSKKLNELNQKFRLNINNYKDHILCNKEELDGLSPEYISSLKKDGTKYKVTLSYPEVGPFLSNAKNREKRKEISIKNSRKGGEANLKLLKEIIDLRIKVAKLLGYKNYTDYKLDNKMAKNSATVNKFVDSLINKMVKNTNKDVALLRSYAKEIGINNLEFYDTAYVAEKLTQNKFNINQELLREYFETEHVLKTMFSTFEDLLSLKFIKKDTKLWHKDVMHIEVRDKDSKKLLAHLLMDLYPRDNKYSHAAAFDTGLEGTKIITLVCNFRTPAGTSKNKIPSTMTLDEVETIYHEFGHALHFMLYNKKYTAQNSFNVAWDFVELPSQMLENFIWNEKSLAKLSKHIKTGKSLSKSEIKNILNSRNFLKPMWTMRQLVQTRLDLDIHTGKIKSYNKHHQDLTSQFIGIKLNKDSLFPAGFGHMSGYDSLYYSYLWALVYAEDVFSVFEEAGVFSKEVGMRYRKEILEYGAARDENVSTQAFLGRKSNNKAFLKSLGI